MSVTTIQVTGMTCGHCVSSVTEEISAIPGVTDVQVALTPGQPSPVTVTSQTDLAPAALAAAVDETGYQIA